MADPNPHVIDALLDAINIGLPDVAYEHTVALVHAAAPPRCPHCGSTEFLVSQFTWNRQRYDSDTEDWGSTFHGCGEYEDHPYAAECADCEADCTDLLSAVIAFQDEPEWTDRVSKTRQAASIAHLETRS